MVMPPAVVELLLPVCITTDVALLLPPCKVKAEVVLVFAPIVIELTTVAASPIWIVLLELAVELVPMLIVWAVAPAVVALLPILIVWARLVSPKDKLLPVVSIPMKLLPAEFCTWKAVVELELDLKIAGFWITPLKLMAPTP